MLNSLDRIYLATILPCHIFLVLTPIGCSTPQIPQVASATADVLDLTRVTNGEPAEFFPQPSPDGSQILFHVRDDTKTTLERWSIAMMNPQNTSERQLVAGPYAQSPAWLPDGSGFIYQYFRSRRFWHSRHRHYFNAKPFGYIINKIRFFCRLTGCKIR